MELKLVVSQLEQDRLVVSNKVRRLQSELESTGTERDVALKVAVELKAKFKALKESSKKDTASLQARIHQVCNGILISVCMCCLYDQCTM